MLKRIITSIVATIIFIPVLIFSNTVVFPIAIAIIALISTYEMAKCMGFDKKLYMTVPVYLVAVALPFLMKYLSFTHTAIIAFVCAVIYLLYLFVIIICSHWKLSFNEAISFFAVTAYILAALNSIMYIRYFDDSGKYIYLLIFFGAWMTDIFAYFTGVFFGKHKLIEDVSPKKTIEGSIGGMFF